ncbi:SCO4402 family protein [Leifsonia shinshuensis]|uniref:Uncharacterized protein n=1 Tax=Leifsonia shinshuensis TaxID=150026 RepID=A0A853D0I0_9MICO|nr:hypothetical protein [Leifsonia shinshuensis]NYJ24924.1 hypothetical protein [Leifsonia shinshuensis]
MAEVAGVAHQVSSNVQYPQMRAEVVHALAALSDTEYQNQVWGHVQNSGAYDDFSAAVHTLYDDDLHLPNAENSIGFVLVSGIEVDRLKLLDRYLGPIIDQLKDSPDSAYLAHPNWPQVVGAAQLALSAMILNN